jgi:serine phosphatase RsbU (regulator of sigma subunit)
VCDIIGTRRRDSASDLVAAIFDATNAFRGTSPQDDDMTAVVVKITDGW